MRITTYDFHFIAVIIAILEIDIIPENFKESKRTVNTFNHGLCLFKRQCRNFVSLIYAPPRIKVFIRCSYCAKSGFNSVGNTSQRAIMKQMRYVAPITDIYLLPSVINCCSGISRIFQLNHTQRQSVDIKQNIRSSVFDLSIVVIFHCKLIDRSENVVFRILEVNQRNHFGDTVLRSKLNTVHHPSVNLMQCCKITFGTYQTHSIYYLLHFFCNQIRVGLAQKLFQIIKI